MKIGLIADTHDAIAPFDTFRDRLAAAFDDVELILHCGDLTTIGLLDRLEEIAPVVAVRSAGDPPPEPPRLFDGPHLVEEGGLSIGLVNSLGEGDPAELFGRPVDVVVHGAIHAASIEERSGVLVVNPGSPTLSDQVSVAVLEIVDGRPSASIVSMVEG